MLYQQMENCKLSTNCFTTSSRGTNENVVVWTVQSIENWKRKIQIQGPILYVHHPIFTTACSLCYIDNVAFELFAMHCVWHWERIRQKKTPQEKRCRKSKKWLCLSWEPSPTRMHLIFAISSISTSLYLAHTFYSLETKFIARFLKIEITRISYLEFE